MYVTKPFLAKSTATLMTAIDNELAVSKLVPFSITRTSDWTGVTADYVIIFTKSKV